MKHLPPPDSYSSLIGTALLLVAVICLLVTFCEKQKSHATKLFSILLVASLSFFSSHWTTYFAAIFIVATAVTELEFLQNLAAIIRKDENYFNFKKEALSREENIKRKAEEVIEDGYALESSTSNIKVASNPTINLSSLQDMSSSAAIKLSIDVEEKALDFIAKEQGRIERGVRFRKDGDMVEFDGIIPSKDNRSNKIYEVKWIRNPEYFLPFMSHTFRRCSEISRRHENITGHKPEINLIVITNTKASISNDRRLKAEERAGKEGINIMYLCLSELGFEVANEPA